MKIKSRKLLYRSIVTLVSASVVGGAVLFNCYPRSSTKNSTVINNFPSASQRNEESMKVRIDSSSNGTVPVPEIWSSKHGDDLYDYSGNVIDLINSCERAHKIHFLDWLCKDRVSGHGYGAKCDKYIGGYGLYPDGLGGIQLDLVTWPQYTFDTSVVPSYAKIGNYGGRTDNYVSLHIKLIGVSFPGDVFDQCAKKSISAKLMSTSEFADLENQKAKTNPEQIFQDLFYSYNFVDANGDKKTLPFVIPSRLISKLSFSAVSEHRLRMDLVVKDSRFLWGGSDPVVECIRDIDLTDTATQVKVPSAPTVDLNYAQFIDQYIKTEQSKPVNEKIKDLFPNSALSEENVASISVGETTNGYATTVKVRDGYVLKVSNSERVREKTFPITFENVPNAVAVPTFNERIDVGGKLSIDQWFDNYKDASVDQKIKFLFSKPDTIDTSKVESITLDKEEDGVSVDASIKLKRGNIFSDGSFSLTKKKIPLSNYVIFVENPTPVETVYVQGSYAFDRWLKHERESTIAQKLGDFYRNATGLSEKNIQSISVESTSKVGVVKVTLALRHGYAFVGGGSTISCQVVVNNLAKVFENPTLKPEIYIDSGITPDEWVTSEMRTAIIYRLNDLFDGYQELSAECINSLLITLAEGNKANVKLTLREGYVFADGHRDVSGMVRLVPHSKGKSSKIDKPTLKSAIVVEDVHDVAKWIKEEMAKSLPVRISELFEDGWVISVDSIKSLELTPRDTSLVNVVLTLRDGYEFKDGSKVLTGQVSLGGSKVVETPPSDQVVSADKKYTLDQWIAQERAKSLDEQLLDLFGDQVGINPEFVKSCTLVKQSKDSVRVTLTLADGYTFENGSKTKVLKISLVNTALDFLGILSSPLGITIAIAIVVFGLGIVGLAIHASGRKQRRKVIMLQERLSHQLTKKQTQAKAKKMPADDLNDHDDSDVTDYYKNL